MSRLSTRQIGFIAAQVVAVAALMFTTFFLHRVAEFSAVCFKSQLVDRLVLFSEVKGELPHCGQNLGWSGSWSRISDHWALRWPRVAARAERLVEVWPLPKVPFRMIVVTEEPFLIDRDGRQLIVGGNVALDSWSWLKELMRAWVQDTTTGITRLESAILTDFFTSVAQDEFVNFGIDGRLQKGDDINWSTAIAPDEYCVSPWRDSLDYEHCESRLPGEAGNLRGLRTLYGRALWELYSRADWRGQRKFWQWLRERVARGHESLIAMEGKPLPGLERLLQSISRWTELTYEKRDQQIQAAYFVKSKLGLGAAQTPYLVIDTSKKIESRFGEIENLVRVDGKLEWWSPENRNKAYNPKVKPLHLVKIDCVAPSLNELANLAVKTVLFVKSCNPETLNGWDSLSSQDLKTFMAANPEAGIIWLNVKGLRQALTTHALNDGTKVGLKVLRRWSHWEEDAWDKAALAFRPRAAIDLVLSHRATRDLL